MAINIIGLGPGGIDLLPLKNLQLLEQGLPIFLRTQVHPVVDDLIKRGIEFKTFDHIYETHTGFVQVYEEIVSTLINEAKKSKNGIIYGVPGHPMVAEKTVKMLLSKSTDLKPNIISAPSGLEAIYTALHIDPCAGLVILDALDFKKDYLNKDLPLLFTQVYNKMIAAELKLDLMEFYSEEHLVTIVKAAGIPEKEQILNIPLYMLDRQECIDHLTSLYIPNENNPRASFASLVEVMNRLRGIDGCPWDKEQTHESLKRYLIEETYEVLDAIDEGDMHKLAEELGDLLLQIVFHGQIAKENADFDINDVVNGITQKMIRRHPHVFGELHIDTSAEVEMTWEKIKDKEKEKEHTQGEVSILGDIPKNMPALLRSEKIQKKAARVGFDWPDMEGPWLKVMEELDELKEALDLKNELSIREEVGDLFFAIVNICRFLDIDPEEALQKTNNKFTKRFAHIENHVQQNKLQWEELNLQELDNLWDEAKKLNKN